MLISWIVRVIIYKDVTKRQEERAREENESAEGHLEEKTLEATAKNLEEEKGTQENDIE